MHFLFGRHNRIKQRAQCHKCGREGWVPDEIRTGFGAGLYRRLPLKGPECVDTGACEERFQVIRWEKAAGELYGQRAKCWTCHSEGVIGEDLTVLADVLWVEEDKYGEIFAGFKWGHISSESCSDSLGSNRG